MLDFFLRSSMHIYEKYFEIIGFIWSSVLQFPYQINMGNYLFFRVAAD